MPKPKTNFKLAILLPWTNMVDAGFAYCLADMMAALGASLDGVGDVKMFEVNGTYIDRSRTDLVREAVQWEATHILFIDSDMHFPQDMAHRLLRHNKDIVGVNYAKRRFPHLPVTFKHMPDPAQGTDSAVFCYTEADSTGLEEVDALGFGGILIRMNVFAKLKPECFETGVVKGTGIYMGEDTHFCHAAKAAGFQIWCDHDLSKQIGHAGMRAYYVTDSVLMRDKMVAEGHLPAPKPKLALVEG